MAPQASDFPPGRVPVHLTQFGGEFCLACLGYVGDTIVEKEEGGKVVYRVAAGSGLEPSAVAAIEAAVAPGAHYRFARRAAEEAASLKRCATLLAIGDAAEAWLDGYADDVADADRAVGGLDFSFEGATRLRFLVGHHAAALEAVGEAVREAIECGGSGGRLADALRRRAGAAGDPSVIRALRVLCGAAEAVFLRAACGWCVDGDLVGDFFVAASVVGGKKAPDFVRDVMSDEADAIGCFEVRASLVPRFLVGKRLAERMLFVGGAVRVLRIADRRRSRRADAASNRKRFLERAVVELESTPRFQAYTSKFGSRPASLSALIIARHCVISLGNGKREKECQTDEGADPEPACYGPDEDGYVALAGRWKALVAAAKAPAAPESAAEAAARDGAVKAGLERLVDDSEKVFAEALLDVCVGDGDLGRAVAAYGGVALLRCGPLWARALELSRVALRERPHGRSGALVVQRCLEAAAEELRGDEDDRTDLEVMAWKAYERAGGVSGAGMCDAVTFWETILAARARRRNAGYPPERVPACPPWTPPGDPAPHLGFGDRPPRPAVDLGDGSAVRFALEAVANAAKAREDYAFAKATETTATVIADPEAFEWTFHKPDVDARFALRKGAALKATADGLELALGGDGAGAPAADEPSDASDGDSDDDDRAPLRGCFAKGLSGGGPDACVEALTPRRVARRPWRLEAACGRADGADGGAVVFACRFRDRGRSGGVSVGIARADDDGALDLVVSLGGDVVTRRRLKRAPETSALALDVAHDRNDAVDGRWELRAACYAATAADYKDGESEVDYARQRAALGRATVVLDVGSVLRSGGRAVCGLTAPQDAAPVKVFRFAWTPGAGERAGDALAGALASLKVSKNSIALKAANFDRSAAETSTGWQQALRAVVRPKWPLDALLFDDAALDYQAAFSRLLAARKAADDLDAVWRCLADAGRRARSREAEKRKALAALSALHTELSAVCRGVATWLQRDGVEPTWRRFVDRLGAASDFAEVKAAHRAFILDLRDALLLDEDAVHGALDDVFLDAARLARLLDAHEDDLEDLPASALARLRGDFAFHADALRGLLPEDTLDFNGWFAARSRAGEDDASRATTTTRLEQAGWTKPPSLS